MKISFNSSLKTVSRTGSSGFNPKHACTALIALGAVYSHLACAVNADPNDYAALAPGTNLLLQYVEYGKDEGLNLDGVGNLPASLSSEVGLLRAIHYGTLFGFTIDPQIIIPFGTLNNVEINGRTANNSSGLGDPVIGMTFWAVNRPETATFFGITPLITLPLGEYRRSDSVNFGNDRVEGDLQLGFQTAFGSSGLAKQIVVTLYADGNFYGANTRAAVRDGTSLTQATLTQETSWQLQPWLSYTTQTGATTVAVGYSASMGGRQLLAGLPNGMRTEEQQVRSEVQTFITKRIQLLGEVTHDTHVAGGFRQDVGFNARILFVL